MPCTGMTAAFDTHAAILLLADEFCLHHFMAALVRGRKPSLQDRVDLAEYPEDRNQQNRDYEQQELGQHVFGLPRECGECSGHAVLMPQE